MRKLELNQSQKNLKERIIQSLKEQGFEISPKGLIPGDRSKDIFRNIQQKSRLEQLSLQKDFLMRNISIIRNYCRSGNEINPEKIFLEIREVKPNSFEALIFKWWDFIWWSIPFQQPCGRRMEFLLWDIAHDAPFGLIRLRSPILEMAVRDQYLGIPKDELNIWINRSLDAHRIGALPPYNSLLGGKMVALATTCNEIREAYREKYKNSITTFRQRKLNSELLFITTMSAFGKSSVYNRLKYNNEIVAKSLGYTRGSGTFHIPDELYQEIISMSNLNIKNERNKKKGIPKKVRLLSKGLNQLGLSSFVYHNIKREFFLFPLAKNLKEVIQKKEEPEWIDRPFVNLVDYWRERWAIPRAERMPEWRNFNATDFFEKTKEMLNEMDGQGNLYLPL